MVSAFVDSKIVHSAVNACLMPLLALDGCHVTTVEGFFIKRVYIPIFQNECNLFDVSKVLGE